MTGVVTPNRMVSPVTPLGHDGEDFWALKTDTSGRLKIRGEDQLFSFKGRYMERVFVDNAADGGNLLYGSVVPSGEIWVVTNMLARDYNTAQTRIYLQVNDGSIDYTLKMATNLGVNEPAEWSGQVYLVGGDRLTAYFASCAAGDDLYFYAHGYKMTVET